MRMEAAKIADTNYSNLNIFHTVIM
jgi:hypothetical protein